jgi:hypothetical protein
MIRDFIETVWGDTEGRVSVWWRQQPGHSAPIDKQKWFAWPEQRDNVVQFIESKADYDVYIPVAVFDADKRTPDHATLVHTLWQDTDTFDPEGYRIPPSIVVNTSPGRTHCWWVLDKPYPAEQAETVVRKITYAHRDAGADVSSWGRNKLLRVPGTHNTSHDWPEEVTADFRGAVYTLAEVANAYDDVPLPTGPSKALVRQAVEAAELPSELPDFLEVQSKLPSDFPIDLITNEPHEGTRSEMRWRLIAELVEAGLTDEEVFVVAWQAKCSDKWREDKRGMDGLWAEVAKERQKYDWGQDEPERPAERPKRVRKRGVRKPVPILSEGERKRARRHFETTWIHEYEEWVRGQVKIYNAPYHRACAWMALSQLIGEAARVKIGPRDVPLCFYFFIMGGTTTGKSQAQSIMQDVIHGAHTGEKNPDIGDDLSIAALYDALRARPNGVAMMSSDEVDGYLAQMKDKNSWRSGDISKYTYLYDGKVPPLLRKGQIDGEWTKVQFSWFGMGTEVKVVQLLDRDMFSSGFLARFQWFFGLEIDVPEENLGIRFGGDNDHRAQRQQITKWAQKFAGIRETWRFAEMSGETAIIGPDSDETGDWFQALTARLEKRLWADDPNIDILRPSLSRTMVAAAKMAALLALSDNRKAFTKDDLLIALWHCEELLGNLYYIAGQVSTSEHAKQLDALYNYILTHGDDTKSAAIFRAMSDRFSIDVATVERYRDELRAQGRIKFVMTGQKHGWTATAIEEEQ